MQNFLFCKKKKNRVPHPCFWSKILEGIQVETGRTNTGLNIIHYDVLGWGLLSTTNVEEKFTNYNYFIKIINEYSPQYLADFTPNTYSYSFSNNSIVYIGLHRQ